MCIVHCWMALFARWPPAVFVEWNIYDVESMMSKIHPFSTWFFFSPKKHVWLSLQFLYMLRSSKYVIITTRWVCIQIKAYDLCVFAFVWISLNARYFLIRLRRILATLLCCSGSGHSRSFHVIFLSSSLWYAFGHFYKWTTFANINSLEIFGRINHKKMRKKYACAKKWGRCHSGTLLQGKLIAFCCRLNLFAVLCCWNKWRKINIPVNNVDELEIAVTRTKQQSNYEAEK